MYIVISQTHQRGAAGAHPGLEDISSPESGIVVLRDQHRRIYMHDIMARLGVEEV